jgi:uncharacterized cupin superfamily protein
MPKLDLSAIPVRSGTIYPEPFARQVQGRLSQSLGDAGGLTQFGVRLYELPPGAWSSHRHWHEKEDEFLMMLAGEVVMIENEGETVLRSGDCATHKAGVANGHHVINRSDKPARFLVVGTRSTDDVSNYPDVDMHAVKNGSTYAILHKDGRPY